MIDTAIGVDTQAIERRFATAWREARGGSAGKVSSAWGQDHVVLLVEDALFAGERVLARDERGSAALKGYLEELLAVVVQRQEAGLSAVLDREVISTSFSVIMPDRLVVIIFRLAV
jgi:hypothetical protein